MQWFIDERFVQWTVPNHPKRCTECKLIHFGCDFTWFQGIHLHISAAQFCQRESFVKMMVGIQPKKV